MYTEFTIRNFRGLRELRLEPLSRINLIAGPNGVGKTTVLEAIWLHHGAVKPNLAVNTNMFRGLTAPGAEAPFESLFHGLAPGSYFEFEARGDWGSSVRSVKAWVDESGDEVVPLGSVESDNGHSETAGASTRSVGSSILRWEYVDRGQGESYESSTRVVEQQVGPGVMGVGLRTQRPPFPKRPTGVFQSAMRRSPTEDAQRLQNLEVAREEADVLGLVQAVDRKVSAIRALPTPQGPLVHADIEGLDRLVPAPLIGDGAYRVLSIGLAMATARDGVLLVDEVENGIFYEAMEAVWRSLAEAARRFNVQVVATTHSLECIRAAHRAFCGELADELTLHRLEERDGQARAFPFDTERLGAALRSGLDVR